MARESVPEMATAQAPANVAGESTAARVTGESTPSKVPAAKSTSADMTPTKAASAEMTPAKAAGVTASASTAARHRYRHSAAERRDRRDRNHYFANHNVFSFELGPGERPGTLADFTTAGTSVRRRNR